MFLIVYATIGIPLMVMMLATFGDKMKCAMTSLLISFEQNILKRSRPQNIPRKLVFTVFLVAGICICILSAISAARENWNFTLALYVSFVSLTTIGFGDYMPEHIARKNPVLEGMEGVYMVAVFLVGLTLMSCIFQVISDWLQSKRAPSKNDLKRSLGRVASTIKTLKEEPSTLSLHDALPRPAMENK